MHKKVCENKDFCNVIVPSEDTEILEFNQYQNLTKHHLLFMQILHVIVEKIDRCKKILKIYVQQK